MAKIKRFDKIKIVKEMAREQVGTVPSSRFIPDKRHKTPKHKGRENYE